MHADCMQVFFLPMSNTIVMCFKDDSIFAWDSEMMQSLYHLYVPTPREKSPGFKAFAVSEYVSRTNKMCNSSMHVWKREPFDGLL